MGFHSSRSPSGAHRYLRCPGAPNAEALLPDKSTIFAAEGTAFHEFAALILKTGAIPEGFIGRKYVEDDYTFVVDQEWVRCVDQGFDRILELSEGAPLFVERRFDLSHVLGPGQSGTMDYGFYRHRWKELVVGDWKFGKGYPVNHIENEQALLYALGFLEWIRINIPLLYDQIETVRIVIDQPRAIGGGGEWVIPIAKVIEFAEYARERTALTYAPDAPRIPGLKQCHFCRAFSSFACPEAEATVLGTLTIDKPRFMVASEHKLPMKPLVSPSNMTPARRAYYLAMKPLVTKFFKELEAGVMTEAMHGRPTPGLKVVEGRRGRRRYITGKEEDAKKLLVKKLGKKAIIETLMSPSVAEKEMTKQDYALLSAFVTQSDGKPTIVAEDHPSKAITPTVADFDALDGDEDARSDR